MIFTIKQAKWLSEETLQIVEKRSERQRRKGKIHLSEQCKETEGNNRMVKPRDLFKKIRDTKRIFHAKTGTVKDRNDMDLTEVEDIKRCYEYKEELY